MSDQPIAPKPPAVPVSIDEPQVLPEEAIAALKRQGFSDIGPEALIDLQRLGIHVHSLGTIRTHRGRALIAQTILDRSMKMLYSALEDLHANKNKKGRLKEMRDTAQTIGYLAARLTDSQALSVTMEGGRANISPDGVADDVTPSFIPGSKVQPGNQTAIVAKEVHFHPPTNPR